MLGTVGKGNGEAAGAEVPGRRPHFPSPRPAPGQVKRGPGSAPGGGAATGVGRGNNSTFIWDCLVQSGWAEEEADGAKGEEGGQRHLAAHLLLLNPVRAGVGAGLRLGEGGGLISEDQTQAGVWAAARMASFPGLWPGPAVLDTRE